MYQTVQKAANDADECKQMLVKMQRQLDRMEEKQDEMVRGGRLNGSLLESKDKNEATQDDSDDKAGMKTPISSSIKKFEEADNEGNEDSSDDEEEEEQSPGGRDKLALVAMAGGAILIGGALQNQLR